MTDFVLEQAIIDLIDIREVLKRLAAGSFVVQTNFVMENGVKRANSNPVMAWFRAGRLR